MISIRRLQELVERVSPHLAGHYKTGPRSNTTCMSRGFVLNSLKQSRVPVILPNIYAVSAFAETTGINMQPLNIRNFLLVCTVDIVNTINVQHRIIPQNKTERVTSPCR